MTFILNEDIFDSIKLKAIVTSLILAVIIKKIILGYIVIKSNSRGKYILFVWKIIIHHYISLVNHPLLCDDHSIYIKGKFN